MLLESLGAVGAATLLAAYFLLTKGRIRNDGPVFHAMNLAGAALVGASAFSKGAWSAAGLEVAWAAIGAWGLWRWRVAARAGGDAKRP